MERAADGLDAEGALARFEARQGPEGRFRRYCRGRVRNLALRLAVSMAGAVALAVLVAPGVGLVVAVLVLAGEALDCGLLLRLARDDRADPAARRLAVVAASVQAMAVALAIAVIWVADPADGTRFFAVAFLIGAAINAGLFLPLFPAAGLVRLSIFAAALGALDLRDVILASGSDPALDIAASLMLAWMTGMFIAFVARADARRTADERTILTEGARLAASQRRLAEKEAEARRLAAVARHANDSVILYAADGSVAWVNDTFTRITGYAAHEVIGRRIEEVMDLPEADPEVVARLTEARRLMRPCRAEVLNRRKSGELFWIETNLTPLPPAEGEAPMMLAVEREVTEAKAREAELARARAEAEETARTKARFLATMSHEIRTPLTGVLGTAELLADTALDPEQAAHVRTILDSGQALLSLINNILDLSRLEAGAGALTPAPFDLAACVGAAVALFGPAARAKGIALGWTPPEGLPRLLGDAGRIRQIVLNLVGNAVKFTESGGVSVGLTWRPADGAAEIALGVADTGIGIAADRLGRVFDRFAQADPEIGRQFGGTGLGLSISRDLARQMGGDIAVQSAPGAGSVFTLTLRLPLAAAEAGPAAAGAAAAAEPVPAGRGAGDGIRHVLLAEDNRTNARILATMLRRAGYRVDHAGDGAAVVEAALRLRPDLVLMDLSMPVLGGFAALAAIRRAEAGTGRRCLVFALTADATAACREACRAAGFDGFLTKPVRRDDLLAAIAAVPAPECAGPSVDGRRPPDTSAPAGPAAAGGGARREVPPTRQPPAACTPASHAAPVTRATHRAAPPSPATAPSPGVSSARLRDSL